MEKGALVKMALAACLSVIVTGTTAWLVFGQDKVTRAEMTDYVRNQAPWIAERGEIQSQIRQNASSVGKLESSVDKLISAQQELLIEQRVLVTKFDEYVKKRDGDGR